MAVIVVYILRWHIYFLARAPFTPTESSFDHEKEKEAADERKKIHLKVAGKKYLISIT